MINAAVIGAGSWGIALSTVLKANGHDVTVWCRRQEQAKALEETGELADKLPGVMLDRTIRYTSDIFEAVSGKDMIIVAVPSKGVPQTARLMRECCSEGQLVVDVAKGIEPGSLFTMPQVLKRELPDCRIGVLSGPSHAEEVARRMPTSLVAGARYQQDAEYIQNAFMNEYIRVYTSPDVLGIGLGGALKNVIALAAGMADGLGYGDNTKAALITRGIKEISSLGLAMGAYRETIEGLSGMGDLIVTCASVHSRNRRAGILIGQGKSAEEAAAEVKMVVEGIYSAKAALELGRRYDVELPIIEGVNRVLFEGEKARDGVYELMQRDKKSEHTKLMWEE